MCWPLHGKKVGVAVLSFFGFGLDLCCDGESPCLRKDMVFKNLKLLNQLDERNVR